MTFMKSIKLLNAKHKTSWEADKKINLPPKNVHNYCLLRRKLIHTAGADNQLVQPHSDVRAIIMASILLFSLSTFFFFLKKGHPILK